MSKRAIVMPIRGLHGGKSRLASVLTDDQRAVLVGAMAQRVLYLALESGVAQHVFLVTRDPLLAHVLDTTDPRVQVLIQPGDTPGLNVAIDLGRLAAQGAGADTLMVLFGDLPLLEQSDIDRLAAASTPIAMVPDDAGIGTNALQLRGREAIARFPMRFGLDSHREHWAAAAKLDLACTDVEAPGIAFDLDTPEDWVRLPESYRDAVAGNDQLPAPTMIGTPTSVEHA